MDVPLIQHLIVVVLERTAPGAEEEGHLVGRHDGLFRRIRQAFARLGLPEVVDGPARLRAGEEVGVVAQQKVEGAATPDLLKVRLALLGRGLDKGPALVATVGEAVQRGATGVEQLRVVALPLRLFFGRERPVAHGHRVAGPAHEHGELLRLFGHFRGDLNRRGSRAEDGHLLPPEVKILRVRGRMDDGPLEICQARKVGQVFLVQQPTREHEVLARGRAPDVAPDSPPSLLVVPGHVDHGGVEERVLSQVQYLVDVRHVAEQLLAVREALRELPCLPDLGDAELIEGRLRVDPRARVAVPIPDAAKVTRGLEDFRLQPLFAEVVEGGDAAEAGANDQRVDLDRLGCGTHVSCALLEIQVAVGGNSSPRHVFKDKIPFSRLYIQQHPPFNQSN